MQDVYLCKGEYKDVGGLSIPDSRIEELLTIIDKDEAEVLNFLWQYGDVVSTGHAWSFLQTMVAQIPFFRLKSKREGL